MSLVPDEALKERLYAIHCARWRAHWSPKHLVTERPWPQSDADWRQTGHGAPWDSNVLMAQWHLDFARKLHKEGLLA